MQFKPLFKRKIRGPLFSTLLAVALLSVTTETANGLQLLSPPSRPLNAIDSEPVHTLLNTFWERNPSNATNSKRTFDEASKNNPTLLVAYAINRIQQTETRESKLITEELTTRYPGNLDGWMLKLWFNTLHDKYDAALINMRSLKRQIDKSKNLPDPTKILIYKRLGRLIGYMQGPVAHRVNKNVLDGTIVAVADGIGADALKAFNESREQVLKTYDDLLKNQAAKTQIELSKVQAENEREQIALERQNQLLEQSEQQLIPEKERIRAAAKKQISSLEQQGNSTQQQLNTTWSDFQATQIDLQFMYADLAALSHPHTRQYVSTFGLRNQIRNAEFSLAALRSDGIGLSNRLNGIGAEIVQTQSSVRQQLNQIQKEINRVSGSKRRNLAKLGKIARGPVIADGKKSSMKNRATSLVTYDKISEELYRQQILDHLTVN